MSQQASLSYFPFGNKYGLIEHDSEFQNFWPWYFNYGFCTNEFKWPAVEKVKGVRNYEKGDTIRNQFDKWNIPLSGNTVLWEVYGKAIPKEKRV